MAEKQTEKSFVPLDVEDNPTVRHNDKPGRKGGKGSRNKRSDTRQLSKNKAAGSVALNAALSRLGLTETSLLTSLRPASSLRPGGVHISLLPYNECVNLMINRIRTVAHRPLANLLTVANVFAYRKVCAYIATARVAAAQDKLPSAVGNLLELNGAILADAFTIIEGKCRTIPQFLSWCLSNIGTFDYSGQSIVPLLPNPVDNATAEQAASANVLVISRYVNYYHGVIIPEYERDLVRTMSLYLPHLNVSRDHRFTDASFNYWRTPVPSVVEWTAFTEINSACSEQGLCVKDFSLTAASGTLAPLIRFPASYASNESIPYYCLTAETPQVERAALVLRLGLDTLLEPHQTRDRFIGNPATALLSGFDYPSTFINAQLTLLNKQDIRND